MKLDAIENLLAFPRPKEGEIWAPFLRMFKDTGLTLRRMHGCRVG